MTTDTTAPAQTVLTPNDRMSNSSHLSPERQEEVKKTHELLNYLWDLCREVILYAEGLDVGAMDKDDQLELAEIERITAAYALAIQEMESASDADYPAVHHIKDFASAIESHCYQCLTALDGAIKMQRGIKPEPIVLLENIIPKPFPRTSPSRRASRVQSYSKAT